MPIIPIILHTHPTSSRTPAGKNSSKRPLYYSIAPRNPPPAPIITTIPPPLPSSASSTSTDPTPTSSRSRRKANLPHRAPSSGYITLTPLNSSILERCLLQNQNTTITPMISPKKGSSKLRPIPQPSVIHPYSRLSDLGNDRSPNPSPREIIREQRQSEERARNKKDSVAAARATAAAKKKPKKTNGKKGALVRSPSPANEVKGLLGLGGSGLSREILPTIMTESATPEATPVLASRSLKRTRSTGIPSVSTNLANSLGTGNLGVGSPLKAVMGPNDDMEEGGGRTKRSRTQEPAGPSSLGSRKKSISPNGDGSRALPERATVPKSHPLASSRLVPTVTIASTRQGNRASSVALGAGLDPASASTGGTGMRRVASATGAAGAGARRESTGSQGSEGVVGARSRREVNLPRALRDYETRPGTMA